MVGNPARCPTPGNILAGLRPQAGEGEGLDTLLETAHLRLERIVSPPAYASPAHQWFDSERDAWVLVVRGRAALAFENDSELVVLNPGDYLYLPAHRRHRVAWTDAHQATVWLALHFAPLPR